MLILIFILLLNTQLLSDEIIEVHNSKIVGDIEGLLVLDSTVVILSDYVYQYEQNSQQFTILYDEKFKDIDGDENIIFAVRNKDNEIFHSQDQGKSWTATEYSENSIYWKSVQYLGAGRAIAVGDSICFTNNYGQNWNNLPSPASNIRYYDLCFFSDCNGYVAGKHSSDKKIYLYKTNNAGQSWQVKYISEKTSYVNLDLFFKGQQNGWLSLSTSSGGDSLYHTSDSGQTWQGIYYYRDCELRADKIMFLNSSRGFAIGEKRSGSIPCMIESKDGGATWSITAQSRFELNSFDLKPGGQIFVGGEYGTFCQYQDTLFTDLTQGYESINFTDIVISEDKIYFGNQDIDELYFYKLNENQFSFGPISFTPFCLCANSPFFISTSTSGKKIYYSPEERSDWQYFNNEFSSSWRDILFINESKGWVIGDSVIETSDSGRAWYGINHLFGQNYYFQEATMVDNIIYFCGYEESSHDAVVLASKDTLRSIETLYQASGHSYSLFFIDSQQGWTGNRNHLLQTKNAGTTWDTVLSLPSGEYIQAILFKNTQTGYIGTKHGNLFYTIDAGKNFDLSYAHPEPINKIKLIRDEIWVCGDAGLIIKTNTPSSALGQADSSSAFHLLTNLYPNPNPGHFQIAFNCQLPDIQVNLFSITGRLIMRKNYSGSHQKTIQIALSSNISSGLYLCRISADNFETTKKVLVIK